MSSPWPVVAAFLTAIGGAILYGRTGNDLWLMVAGGGLVAFGYLIGYRDGHRAERKALAPHRFT